MSILMKKVKKNPLVKSLIKEIKANGYSVFLVPSWRQIGMYNAMGVCSRYPDEMYVKCTLYDKNGKPRKISDIAFILAHELRHTQHIINGMYKSYYTREDNYHHPEIVAVGVRAEKDCDKYARKRLREANVYSTLMNRTYSRHKVAGYVVYKVRQSLKVWSKSYSQKDANNYTKYIKLYKKYKWRIK